VPKPHTSNAAAHGRFDRADFTYLANEDAYVCPAGERLTYRFTNTEAGKTLHSYWTDACGSCDQRLAGHGMEASANGTKHLPRHRGANCHCERTIVSSFARETSLAG
jgi:hypothetical protein